MSHIDMRTLMSARNKFLVAWEANKPVPFTEGFIPDSNYGFAKTVERRSFVFDNLSEQEFDAIKVRVIGEFSVDGLLRDLFVSQVDVTYCRKGFIIKVNICETL